jgi:hypothetical protein
VLAAPIATEYHDVNDVEKTRRAPERGVQACRRAHHHAELFLSEVARRRPALHRQYPWNGRASTSRSTRPSGISDEFHLEALSVKYRTDTFEISSATSYWSRHEPLQQDTQESWTTYLLPFGYGITGYTAGNGNLGQAYADENNNQNQTTEELRVSSVGDARFKWLFGYFYSDFVSPWDIVFPSQSGASNPNIATNDLFSYFTPFKILQQSFFGEVTYNITEPLSVTVGARRYHYDSAVYLDQFGGLAGGTTVQAASENCTGRDAEGDAVVSVRQGSSRVCDGGQGLPPRRRHRSGADPGRDLLRGAASGRVQLERRIRRGACPVQLRHHMELRARREMALGR